MQDYKFEIYLPQIWLPHAARPTQHFAFNYHAQISMSLALCYREFETYTCPSSWAIVNAALSPLS